MKDDQKMTALKFGVSLCDWKTNTQERVYFSNDYIYISSAWKPVPKDHIDISSSQQDQGYSKFDLKLLIPRPECHKP